MGNFPALVPGVAAQFSSNLWWAQYKNLSNIVQRHWRIPRQSRLWLSAPQAVSRVICDFFSALTYGKGCLRKCSSPPTDCIYIILLLLQFWFLHSKSCLQIWPCGSATVLSSAMPHLSCYSVFPSGFSLHCCSASLTQNCFLWCFSLLAPLEFIIFLSYRTSAPVILLWRFPCPHSNSWQG